MYTEADAAELGVYWTSVPCKHGEVRVTLPHIPHGAHGPATSTRRTMLPWFIGLKFPSLGREASSGTRAWVKWWAMRPRLAWQTL
jgi:hypothetical protein